MEPIIYRELTLCVPWFAGNPLRSWGPRIKSTQPVG